MSILSNEKEFPTLSQASQISVTSRASNRDESFKTLGIHLSQSGDNAAPSTQEWSQQTNDATRQATCRSSSSDRSTCKNDSTLGISTHYLHYDLQGLIRKVEQDGASFVVTPIEPSERSQDFEALADFSLGSDDWSARVHIYLGDAGLNSPDESKEDLFRRSFQHALYLKSQYILIDCPRTDYGRLSLAAIINKYTQVAFGNKHDPFILFVVPLVDVEAKVERAGLWLNEERGDQPSDHSDCDRPNSSQSSNTSGRGSNENANASPLKIDELLQDIEESDESNWLNDSDLQEQRSSSQSEHPSFWHLWNKFRSHLNPYKRMGICIEMNTEPPSDKLEVNRWAGEHVRMVIFHTDSFVQSPEGQYFRLAGRYKEFLKAVSLKNSFKNKTVLATRGLDRLKEYLDNLNHVIDNLLRNHQDYLRDWNDYPQTPMQPLATNLSSGIYSVFERDSIKYIKYKDAMIAALQGLIAQTKCPKKFTLMVLGAGRGPLVDNFIAAIKMVAPESEYRFKIYALDKNFSSVRSLKHKQQNLWLDPTNRIETEVVECDMRVWNPPEKADIIATELLGSLGDNELSPECIDGVWRFSTPDTISIPQSYASYIQPISSWRMRQILSEHSDNPMEKIWVVRLNNFDAIDQSKKLFEFEHRDLSLKPEQRNNRRYTKLTFKSKIDTVCDGFAGYFNSELFGKTNLSIMPDDKTPNMDSWFPAFIPLVDPIQLPKDTELEVHFWRKESVSKVWYEWAVTKPVRTKIHSPNGSGTAMSKFIDN